MTRPYVGNLNRNDMEIEEHIRKIEVISISRTSTGQRNQASPDTVTDQVVRTVESDGTMSSEVGLDTAMRQPCQEVEQGFLADDEREEEGGSEDEENEKPFAAKFAALKNVDKPSFKRKRNEEVDDYEEYERSVNDDRQAGLMSEDNQSASGGRLKSTRPLKRVDFYVPHAVRLKRLLDQIFGPPSSGEEEDGHSSTSGTDEIEPSPNPNAPGEDAEHESSSHAALARLNKEIFGDGEESDEDADEDGRDDSPSNAEVGYSSSASVPSLVSDNPDDDGPSFDSNPSTGAGAGAESRSIALGDDAMSRYSDERYYVTSSATEDSSLGVEHTSWNYVGRSAFENEVLKSIWKLVKEHDDRQVIVGEAVPSPSMSAGFRGRLV